IATEVAPTGAARGRRRINVARSGAPAPEPRIAAPRHDGAASPVLHASTVAAAGSVARHAAVHVVGPGVDAGDVVDAGEAQSAGGWTQARVSGAASRPVVRVRACRVARCPAR